ncbi:MAG: prepilin-type N-terminal cleavage/methylation domain-containing protein [Opitutaceae bacterium]|nr:prepilin-type N-terminal cleavage/methylation domain-containing protein [Opitutaceae bacterium]
MTSGFTLVELLVVIAIIGILAAITIPVVARVRESANAAACISNLRQTGFAFQLYLDDNKGNAPIPWSSSTQYWYNQLLGTSSSERTNYVNAKNIPPCRAANLPQTHPHYASGGYGMTDLQLWYPFQRVAASPRFYSTRLQRPRDWPLFMDADNPCIYGLDNPVETEAKDSRFSARHGNTANILMADIHIEKASWGDKRWHQNKLNDGSFYAK